MPHCTRLLRSQCKYFFQKFTMEAHSWEQLIEISREYKVPNKINGPTNSQATLRLFAKEERDVQVTFYRDNHAWCPYCQKVWLFLEEKQIPYRIKKVTMFCYGEKEAWFKKIVPSGMLPALELNGKIITESDDILQALEKQFGPLEQSLSAANVLPLRKLERYLFRAWCGWLCYENSAEEEKEMKKQFLNVVKLVEAALSSTPGDYFLDKFGIVDAIFTPYVERMNASLFYYKGYSLRDENPNFSRWFDAMESRATYRGTQSDFHTHCHDLPPQMGGCYSNNTPQALINANLVDHGPWFDLKDAKYTEPSDSSLEALYRVIKHKDNIVKVNPFDHSLFDQALRAALTNMLNPSSVIVPPPGSELPLRYLRDRINVPRDMSIYAGKRLRQALEKTADAVGGTEPPPITKRHRRDQDPQNFK